MDSLSCIAWKPAEQDRSLVQI